MRYLGGKAKGTGDGTACSRIAAVVRALVPDCAGRRYLEPFVGGGSVLAEQAPHFASCAAGDAHLDLVMMWRALQLGWVPPRHVSREQHAALRRARPSPLRGFVGFGMSHGGAWFKGYADAARDGRSYCGAARRSVLHLSRSFTRVDFRHGDYRLWDLEPGDVLYCDPPYARTTAYSTEAFDSAAHWRWAEAQAEAGVLTFVSEYEAPPPWTCVLEMRKRVTVSASTNTRTATERLFAHPATLRRLSRPSGTC